MSYLGNERPGDDGWDWDLDRPMDDGLGHGLDPGQVWEVDGPIIAWPFPADQRYRVLGRDEYDGTWEISYNTRGHGESNWRIDGSRLGTTAGHRLIGGRDDG